MSMHAATGATGPEHTNDVEQVAALQEAFGRIRHEVGRRIVGQTDLVDHLLITLFAGGHSLFVGVPGLAKTLLIQSLADALDLSFNRIQFTPDLMPSDITGTDIIQTAEDGSRSFEFVKGPVFCNILLADEINRTPPKTQAALLQSMQERRVTASGQTYPLPLPFHVFATQNPIEQEGTYPLPEAQLDRFMMMLEVDYPSANEEEEIVKQTTSTNRVDLEKVLGPEQLRKYQDLILRIPIADPLVRSAVSVVRRSRPKEPNAPSEIREFVSFGAGPRAAQHIVLAAKARAALQGRPVVDGEDIKALARPILRHRLVRNFQAEARSIGADELINSILEDL